MLISRNPHPIRKVDLKCLIGKLGSDFPNISEVYIFGSRRFLTGSVRSDIDLLLVTDQDTVDYQLPKCVRRVEPYVDAFQAVGGTALSFANHSKIKQANRSDLLKEISALLLWSAANGWVGAAEFENVDVLSGSVPEYSVAQLEPGTIDPARRVANVVVVTALQKEYDAICERMAKIIGCESHKLNAGELFEIERCNADTQRVVVVRASRMGPVSAALETLLSIEEWSPTLVVLAGITAGIAKQGVQLGDVVIPDRILEYEALKVEANRSSFHGIVPTTSASHTKRILEWDGLRAWEKRWGSELPASQDSTRTNHILQWKWLSALTRKWWNRSPAPRDSIVIHTDAMASGGKVVASERLLESISTISRKVCSVEMEAIGVAEACSVRPIPTPFIVVKAVTDLADADKDDRYHPFATAAVADLLAVLVEADLLG
jgi:nucleoside phosphorylase